MAPRVHHPKQSYTYQNVYKRSPFSGAVPPTADTALYAPFTTLYYPFTPSLHKPQAARHGLYLTMTKMAIPRRPCAPMAPRIRACSSRIGTATPAPMQVSLRLTMYYIDSCLGLPPNDLTGLNFGLSF